MASGNEDDTGRRRRSEPEEYDWHDRLVEHFGADGRTGEWGRTMKVIDRHDLEISGLMQLKWKLFGAITLGGAVAGLVAFLVQRAFNL